LLDYKQRLFRFGAQAETKEALAVFKAVKPHRFTAAMIQ
jgi:hypothetical protein